MKGVKSELDGTWGSHKAGGRTEGFPSSSISGGEVSGSGQEGCLLRGWSVCLTSIITLGPSRSSQRPSPGRTRERRSRTDGQRDRQLAACLVAVEGQS